MAATKITRLGDLLVDKGVISKDQLAVAIREQKQTGELMGEILNRLGFASSNVVGDLLAGQAGIERVGLSTLTPEPDALGKIPKDFALSKKVIAVLLKGGSLTVAMANPMDISTISKIQRMARLSVDVRYAPESEIAEAIEKHYGNGKKTEGGADRAEAARPLRTDTPEDMSAINIVKGIITDAVRENATDIHLEPEAKLLRLRNRVDGIMHERSAFPKELQPALTTRIKVQSGMNISETRLPQDGAMKFAMDGKEIDLRVSTFPTINGENIVLRILDRERLVLGLDSLGMCDSDLQRFKSSILSPYGIILITGPTGCGKTTTLYTTLSYMNSTEKNIMTLEDPVEYALPNIRQAQINLKAGFTFASGLRSILRQDPDIILVGETRDSDTLDISIRSALTGHLVYSTLHTNDAAGSIPRLLEMGAEPFLLAASLVAIVAQRLVRKICKGCIEPYTPAEEILISLNCKGDKRQFYRGKGCKFCDETGYKGRVGLFEILRMNPAIARMITEGADAGAIRNAAMDEGMTSMTVDGIRKALSGMTTLDEVVRVAYTV